MACKCLRILPAKIVAHYNQPGIPEQPLVLRARFKDLMFPMRDGEITSALKTDVLLAIEGRKSPKIITMTFTYCPWCGVRYTEDV